MLLMIFGWVYSMLDKWLNILIISSHTDDAELAMGGTIRKLVNDGYDVRHLILSHAPEQAIARGFDPDDLIRESMEANKILGIKKDKYHLVNPGYQTDYFHLHRQEIANTLAKAKEYFKPDVVFVNSSFDTHQDHQVTHQEAVRVFKEIGIIGYEFPYNNLEFKYDLLVGLTEDEMYYKIGAIKSFESQQDRVYCDKDYIYSLGIVNAVRIKTSYPYAEAFEVVRLVW